MLRRLRRAAGVSSALFAKDETIVIRPDPARRAALAAAFAAALLPAPALAQNADAAAFPSRPIRMVVPYVPGGLPDTLGRIVAQRLGDAFKRPVLIDNRPGAGGIIGTELVARALPDGYTLLVADLGQTAITPAMTPKLPYDIRRDFAPVSLLGTSL